MPDERASALDAEGGDTAVSVEMIPEVEHAMEAFLAIEDPEETEGGAKEAEPHHPHGERFAGGQRGDVGERVGDDGRVFGAETTVDHEALMFVGGEGVGDGFNDFLSVCRQLRDIFCWGLNDIFGHAVVFRNRNKRMDSKSHRFVALQISNYFGQVRPRISRIFAE